MRTVLVLIGTVILISSCRPAAAPVSVSSQPVGSGQQTGVSSVQPTKPLGDMSWTDADERVQKISDMKGKALILDFWATDCPPCREEIPHLNSLIAKYGKDNLQIVGLHVGDEEDRKQIPAFSQAYKIDYPIAFPDAELSDMIFAERDDIPQSAVFDRQGRMVTKIVGFSPNIEKQLDAAVDQAVRSE